MNDLYFSIRDAAYWYEIHGDGAETLVLLHGFTGSTETWRFFVEKRPEELQLILIDLPGHGKTKTNHVTSMEACCHDLKLLFDQIGLEKFHLAGYSMGGRTALSFTMLYPEYVTSLILESASPGLAEAEERKARIKKDEQLANKLEAEGIEAFVHYWENIPLFASQKRLHKDERKTIRKERLSQSAQGLTQSLRSMGTGSQPSWWHLLGKIRIPVLLLVGELDAKYVAINKKMQAAIPKSKLIICEDIGHAVHVEDRDAFIRHAVLFITDKEDVHDGSMGKSERV